MREPPAIGSLRNTAGIRGDKSEPVPLKFALESAGVVISLVSEGERPT